MESIKEWLVRPGGLAHRLRALRKSSGLSGVDISRATGWPSSKLSKIEHGRQLPSVADLEAWAAAVGVDESQKRQLLDLLAQASEHQSEWRYRIRTGQESVQEDYNRLYEDADVVRNFQTAVLPSMVQTADYARAVLANSLELHPGSVDDVDVAVTARLRRQAMLYDETKRFEFLVCEAALRWLICPVPTMLAQLDRLHSVIGLSNVRFGILPMGRRLPVSPQNPFVAFDNLVLAETFVGETVHRGDGDGAVYLRVFDALWSAAATGDDARQLVINASRASRGE